MKAIKKIGILVLLSITTVAFAQNAQKAQKVQKTQKVQNKTVCFDVNVHCDNCKAKIEKNIAYEKGVKDLDVSVEKKTVKVTYDPSKTDEETLIASLQKIGYVAKVQPENNKAEKKKK